jgi:hypothetical protein
VFPAANPALGLRLFVGPSGLDSDGARHRGLRADVFERDGFFKEIFLDMSSSRRPLRAWPFGFPTSRICQISVVYLKKIYLNDAFSNDKTCFGHIFEPMTPTRLKQCQGLAFGRAIRHHLSRVSCRLRIECCKLRIECRVPSWDGTSHEVPSYLTPVASLLDLSSWPTLMFERAIWATVGADRPKQGLPASNGGPVEACRPSSFKTCAPSRFASSSLVLLLQPLVQ